MICGIKYDTPFTLLSINIGRHGTQKYELRAECLICLLYMINIIRPKLYKSINYSNPTYTDIFGILFLGWYYCMDAQDRPIL